MGVGVALAVGVAVDVAVAVGKGFDVAAVSGRAVEVANATLATGTGDGPPHATARTAKAARIGPELSQRSVFIVTPARAER